MPHYLAEGYVAEATSASLAADAERMRAALHDVEHTMFLQALYLPGDETCFFLFESMSAELVGRVAALAGIAVDRVVPVSFHQIRKTEEAMR